MHASGKLLTAASLLFGAVYAIPAHPAPTPVLNARAPDATGDAWITVDESGTPVTVTPVVTVIDGTTTTISAAPNDVTATVITNTNNGDVRTSTVATPPDPTATSTDGSGAFAVCHNTDGANAPFCQPSSNSSLYPGKTYYITWDSAFFDSNTTVIIEGSYYNATTDMITTQAFASGKIAAGWSYYAWTVDSKLMNGASAANITLSINALANGNSSVASHRGPRVLVTNPPSYRMPEAKLPTGAALYIGLPSVAGFVVLMIMGTCWWNRKHRKISIGNIMSRSRHGYGVAKSRAKRMRTARRDRKEAVRLMEFPEDQHYYRDEPQPQQQRRQIPRAVVEEYDECQDGRNGLGIRGHARRDSDALGSLAGTPTEEREMGFPRHQQSSGNAFREEMERQNRQRS